MPDVGHQSCSCIWSLLSYAWRSLWRMHGLLRRFRLGNISQRICVLREVQTIPLCVLNQTASRWKPSKSYTYSIFKSSIKQNSFPIFIVHSLLLSFPEPCPYEFSLFNFRRLIHHKLKQYPAILESLKSDFSKCNKA